MRALICGSIAYDTIMVFEDQFKNHILPEQVHILNVSFHVPSLRREFGGCAGNIAYNLSMLGVEALPMGTVGEDFAPYRSWMDRKGIRRDFIQEKESTYTAQAFITTDLDDNQITAFHPGAMDRSHENPVDTQINIPLGIVSPDGKLGMIQHAAQLAEADIPFIFDPGQGLPLFSGEELKTFIEQATWLTLNDYEAKLLAEKTGYDTDDLLEYVEAVIVTRGAEGSIITTREAMYEIPVVPAAKTLDPTGCGDAYRAGILYGLLQGLDWHTTGCLGALLGSIKVAHHGTQNHSFTPDEIRGRFGEAFGRSL